MELTTAEGQKYYYNERKGETTWDNPKAAAAAVLEGWETCVDEAGQTYYFNAKLNQTSWTLPQVADVNPEDNSSDWTAHTDEKTGQTFYYSMKNKRMTLSPH